MIPRVAVAVAGLFALALPLPGGGMFVVTAVGLVSVVFAVARPGSAAPAMVIAAGVLTWLATPSGSMHDLRLVTLALAISVLHSGAALAALVPAHARVPTRLALRWVGWAAVAATVGVGALGAASLVPTGQLALPVTVIAVAAAGSGGALMVAFALREAHS